MLAVIAEPVAAAATARRLARLRRRFDPRFGRVPAHVTLVFPKSGVAVQAGRDRLTQAARATPGTIRASLGRAETLRTPGPRGWYVVLPVMAGGAALARLHHRLSRPPFAGNRRSTAPYRPHVTVAAGLDAATARRVRHLADSPRPAPFAIGTLALVAWDGRRLATAAEAKLGNSRGLGSSRGLSCG